MKKDLKKKVADSTKAEPKSVSADPFESLAESAPAAKSVTKKVAAKKATARKSSSKKSLELKSSKPPKAKAAIEVGRSSAKTATATSPVKRGSSRVASTISVSADVPTLDITAALAAGEPAVEVSPAFKALAQPVLPALKRENRARLLMQSPVKLYFYWSLRKDPYHMLRDAFGDDTGSYALVLKLTDLRHGTEEIHRCEGEGNWWFDVEPDGEYQAEIGFYAPNRPYFRLIYSNTIETPRRSPSRHSASEASWTVSSSKFAEVLDISGFPEDAVEVSILGDDGDAASESIQQAFADLTGSSDTEGIGHDNLRQAMFAIAAGRTLEELRFAVGARLFAILQSHSEYGKAENARRILGEHFDVDEFDFETEQFGPAVYGSSRINFPRTLKTRRTSARYAPLSSSTVVRASSRGGS